jgi:DNA-binding GntR family transcriptional regulator
MKSRVVFKKGMSAYYQIKEDVISRINNGEWPLGGKIPSELELVDFYGVSRMTLRKALDELADEEIVYKERGIGTFAAKRQIVRNQEHLSGLSEEMAAQNRTVRSAILAKELIDSPSICRDLTISDSRVYHLQRLRYVNGEALLLDDTYIPPEIADQAGVEQIDEDGSLFRLIESSGQALLYGEKEVHAVLASDNLARLLSYAKGNPLFYVKTVIYNQRGTPILVSELHVRAERYSIKISAKRY